MEVVRGSFLVEPKRLADNVGITVPELEAGLAELEKQGRITLAPSHVYPEVRVVTMQLLGPVPPMRLCAAVLGSRDVVLVVGPNNAGKSATLRGIRDKLNEPSSVNPVLLSLEVEKRGTLVEFRSWLSSWTKRQPGGGPQNPGSEHLTSAGFRVSLR
jgi:hypothetical protein